MLASSVKDINISSEIGHLCQKNREIIESRLDFTVASKGELPEKARVVRWADHDEVLAISRE